MLSGIPFSGVFRSAIIQEENLKLFSPNGKGEDHQ
jgi:hypothetical protein